MRSTSILIATFAAAAAAARCGGGSTSTPTAPTATTPSIATVSIVGTQGNGSFVPNPVQAGNGNQVMFKNSDPVNVHHIVMDNGSADFGNLSPGATSSPRTVTSGNFHCTNHPSMVGSINGTTVPVPPLGSGDGY